jgi:hypothetical protein
MKERGKILKPTLKKEDGRAWGRFHLASRSEQEQVADRYKHFNKTSGYTKYGQFLEQKRTH